MEIEAALKKAEAWMDDIDGVVGIAQGKTGETDCITVFLSLPEMEAKIPKTFHGHPVVVEFSGPLQALPV